MLEHRLLRYLRVAAKELGMRGGLVGRCILCRSGVAVFAWRPMLVFLTVGATGPRIELVLDDGSLELRGRHPAPALVDAVDLVALHDPAHV